MGFVRLRNVRYGAVGGGGSENCFLLGLPLQYVLTDPYFSYFSCGFLLCDTETAQFLVSVLPGRALVHVRAPL